MDFQNDDNAENCRQGLVPAHVGVHSMKLAGFLLLFSGWIIVLSAIILFPSATPRAWFIFAGVCVEMLGLVLVFRSHLELRKERG